RHQAIEELFKYWDEQKYANLTLELISTLQTELGIFKAAHQLTDEDFERFIQEERQYLVNLKKPRGNELEFAYVQALEALEDAERILQETGTPFIMVSGMQNPQEQQATARKARAHSAALRKHELRLDHVVELEDKLSIANNERWSKMHPKRLEVVQALNLKDYHAALDHLERLVVQRLFELTKLNMSGTGTLFSLTKHVSSDS
ncbi:hypothetical protein M422DRAFT_127352, partial [Sphaerobolus stellatus SS14]